MKVTFTKLASHRVFDHQAIYYDQKKEEREGRERMAKEELGLLSDDEKEVGYGDRIRGGMRRRIKPHYEISRSIKRKSNIRLGIILIILMALVSYLIRSGEDWMIQFLGQ